MFRAKAVRTSLAVLPKLKSSPSFKLNQQYLNYHATSKLQNDLIIGGIAVAGSAMALQYAFKAFNSLSAAKPAEEKNDEAQADQSKESTASSSSSTAKKAEKKEKPTNATVSAFETWFAKNFYDGGFEDKMSKREAALILGVRESASPERIKDAHRRILLLNHPDRGGSAFISAKVNEAKDLLLKGKV